jgi:hypothetical protein
VGKRGSECEKERNESSTATLLDLLGFENVCLLQGFHWCIKQFDNEGDNMTKRGEIL